LSNVGAFAKSLAVRFRSAGLQANDLSIFPTGHWSLMVADFQIKVLSRTTGLKDADKVFQGWIPAGA
jgi:hypothetical protein